MLTSKQRATLRGIASTMDPVFQVGKGDIDETLVQGVLDCLKARELDQGEGAEKQYVQRQGSCPHSGRKNRLGVCAGDRQQVRFV